MNSGTHLAPRSRRHVSATAVATIRWLSASDTTIVVPVYQRQYRWDIGGCEQLLADVRAVADAGAGQTHFIGSILSTASSSSDDDAHLVLIDGQQRITTLMLLVAALHHTLRDDDPALAAELERVLVRSDDPTRTKLRPHRAWADVFESVVLGRREAARRCASRGSTTTTRSSAARSAPTRPPTSGAACSASSTCRSPWARRERAADLREPELHRRAAARSRADPQLRPDGLSHAEQGEIEDEYWVPIEHDTGEQIGDFWRHYLVMLTGREVTVAGERGVYDTFRPSSPASTSRRCGSAPPVARYAGIYRILLDPARADDPVIARQLTYLNTFGRGMYPLALRLLHEHGEATSAPPSCSSRSSTCSRCCCGAPSSV
jgi:hypothetical protein